MTRRALLAAGGGSPGGGGDVDPPPTEYPWFAGPANIVVDGNSVYANYYTDYGAFSNHIMMVEPFLGGPYTHADCAITSQTWANMTDNATDVDAAWVDGVPNVLVVAETTNSVYFNNRSQIGTIADATAYLTRVRSAHPDWIILLCGSLPADGGGISDVAARNATMIAVDNHMSANYAAMGADGYVGYRDLPPFVGNGVTTPYTDFADCWFDHVHPADPGKAYMRQRVVEGLLALPNTR